MRRRSHHALCYVVICVGLSGCAVPLAPVVPPPASIELTDVPFVAQTTDQCGPAALAMALSHSGAQVPLDELRKRVHLPNRKGSLQLELLAATRHYQRLAYKFAAQPEDLFRFLEDGWPVVVLQNLGAKWLPIWHYAVVVGYDQDHDQLVMRSGNEARRLMGRAEFVRRWSASEYWGLVVFTPEATPSAARPVPFLESVSGHEALGHWELARAGYMAALSRWPENAYAELGLGNAHLGLGAVDQAIRAYQSALRLDATNVPALNNLAYAYAEIGDPRRALEMIARAQAELAGNEELAADLRALEIELTGMGVNRPE